MSPAKGHAGKGLQMTSATAPNALVQVQTPAVTGQSLIETVARRFKVNPFRQFVEMFRMKGGRNQMSAREYYEFEIYSPSYTQAQKREFVGEKGNYTLNLTLSPPTLTQIRSFLADKVGLTTMMAGLGLPTTRLQAAFAPTRGFGTLRTLRSADDVVDFLIHHARFPLFGKPIRGAQAIGSVMILGVDAAAGTARLGTGETVALTQVAAEVASNTLYGYVFQDAVPVHPDIARLSGSPAVSTVRVVTINTTGTPEVLYTVWKLPSPSAMSDNFWQKGSLLCLVDKTSGVVQRVRHGSGLNTEWLENHPVTGAQINGITLPDWQSVLDLALAAHATVPDSGLLGWDIALTPNGALLIECNENTGHAFYQLAASRGILNADFLPVFDRIKARNTAFSRAFHERRMAYQKAKYRF